MYIYFEIYWFKRDWYDFFIFCEKMILSSMLKFVMLKMLLMVVVVIIRVGIFLFSLQLVLERVSSEGIIMVGDIVVRVNLEIREGWGYLLMLFNLRIYYMYFLDC